MAIGWRSLGFIFSGLLSLSLHQAHADFALVSFETTGMPSDVCKLDGHSANDYILASQLLQKTASDRKLTVRPYYFVGDGECDHSHVKIIQLFQGTASDVGQLAANPPVFKGSYLSFTFKVETFQTMTSNYYLTSTVDIKQILNILSRPVSTLQTEQTFVGNICQPSPVNLLNALQGTPQQAAAAAYIQAHPSSWILSYNAALNSDSGQVVNIAGPLWNCPIF